MECDRAGRCRRVAERDIVIFGAVLNHWFAFKKAKVLTRLEPAVVIQAGGAGVEVLLYEPRQNAARLPRVRREPDPQQGFRWRRRCARRDGEMTVNREVLDPV